MANGLNRVSPRRLRLSRPSGRPHTRRAGSKIHEPPGPRSHTKGRLGSLLSEPSCPWW
jgi:hypothetical protein